jgi:uroporphyrinogen-III synthase
MWLLAYWQKAQMHSCLLVVDMDVQKTASVPAWQVVVTQSGMRGRELTTQLCQLSIPAFHCPIIETVERPFAEIVPHLSRLPAVDGVIITSAPAARVMVALQKQMPDWQWPQTVCYCIGEATAQAVQQAGGMTRVFPGVRDGGDLADAMIGLWPRGGKTFLFIRGAKARTELPDKLRHAGHRVESLVVYDTKAQALPELDWTSRQVIWLLFSPSGVQALLSSLPRLANLAAAKRHQVISFGRTTTNALNAADVPVAAVPSTITHEALIETVSALYGRLKKG